MAFRPLSTLQRWWYTPRIRSNFLTAVLAVLMLGLGVAVAAVLVFAPRARRTWVQLSGIVLVAAVARFHGRLVGDSLVAVEATVKVEAERRPGGVARLLP